MALPPPHPRLSTLTAKSLCPLARGLCHLHQPERWIHPTARLSPPAPQPSTPDRLDHEVTPPPIRSVRGTHLTGAIQRLRCGPQARTPQRIRRRQHAPATKIPLRKTPGPRPRRTCRQVHPSRRGPRQTPRVAVTAKQRQPRMVDKTCRPRGSLLASGQTLQPPTQAGQRRAATERAEHKSPRAHHATVVL